MTRVLLHICCGPCASYPVPALREEGLEPVGYFHNPNIHPYREWQQRRQALEKYADIVDLKVIYDEAYNPRDYFQNVAFRESQRCFICYRMRLQQAAHIARRGRFDCFSTTLLVSKHQKHEIIRELGEAIGIEYGVPFLYRDFRVGFKQSGENARAMELYRQQYCGCLYSEVERYAPAEIRRQLK
ncbi:MAG: epoxyqueuosine reductase QueH [Syntrophomonas sp.]|nr:epoxyqueuosine reductase QueH [Syntrophomonas sp.]